MIEVTELISHLATAINTLGIYGDCAVTLMARTAMITS